MRLAKALLFALPLTTLALVDARDAAACGGCLVQQKENTQVTGHRMVLSISAAQSTLWDQVSYSGNPTSFAWVLPIRGTVDVGLSSDALFEYLTQSTQVTVNSPQIQCQRSNCGNSKSSPSAAGASDFGSAGAGGGSAPPPVNVISQKVVGPYETVQLQSTNPNAMRDWLTGHGYNIPADISPVIDAYVKDGFNFLALKLVPGEGVSAMRPVRVTTTGASPVLPLRMVAAGTGAITPITLWVVGEGRYEPAAMPTFEIHASELVWDWDSKSSNYAVLKKASFDAAGGKAWLVEAGEPTSMYGFQGLIDGAKYDPVHSGYADDMGNGAPEAAAADVKTLLGTLNPSAIWVTRLHAELPRAALAADLELGASADQMQVARFLQATISIGTPPACPKAAPCGSPAGNGANGWGFWNNTADGSALPGKTGCAFTSAPGMSTAMSGLVLAAALTLARRRRRHG